MRHLDLFSGIGGFAYAVDQVWPGSTHDFCDNDNFCQQVLAKHWPESKIYGDIRTLTNTKSGEPRESSEQKRREDFSRGNCDLLTGGFPCQPFSAAGQRKGTADDRYLWPEMLRVIREFNPTWIIAENVRGLLTWNEGLVFEQVCTDLEREGYEVQSFIIPACGVNAPHRRDRIWFIAHTKGSDDGRIIRDLSSKNETQSEPKKQHKEKTSKYGNASWNRNWVEVATELCRVDDGASPGLDKFGGFTKAGHRKERLKSLGNAIVPQVAIKIMEGIRLANYSK